MAPIKVAAHYSCCRIEKLISVPIPKNGPFYYSSFIFNVNDSARVKHEMSITLRNL